MTDVEPSSPEPAYPDFYVCDSVYGTDMSFDDCGYLVDQLPFGDNLMPYTYRKDQQSKQTYELPLRRVRGMSTPLQHQ